MLWLVVLISKFQIVCYLIVFYVPCFKLLLERVKKISNEYQDVLLEKSTKRQTIASWKEEQQVWRIKTHSAPLFEAFVTLKEAILKKKINLKKV